MGSWAHRLIRKNTKDDTSVSSVPRIDIPSTGIGHPTFGTWFVESIDKPNTIHIFVNENGTAPLFLADAYLRATRLWQAEAKGERCTRYKVRDGMF
jgi:hypothetical protein